MKLDFSQLLFFFALITFIACLPAAEGSDQVLTFEEYRDQINAAIDAGDTNQVRRLVNLQRGDAILTIEALLDSGVIKMVRDESGAGERDWMIVKTLAEIYSVTFGDDFYSQSVKRYHKFGPEALAHKAEIIDLKNKSKQNFYQGNFQAALENYQRALDLAEKIGDDDEKAALLGNIGAAHFYLGRFDTALDYYEESLTRLEKLGDRRRIGNRLGNIASVYSDKSDYTTAIAYYEKALEIRDELDDKRGTAADLNNIGLVYEEMGEYTKALERYHAACEINKVIGNERSMGKNLANMANIHVNFGDYPEAIQTYEQAMVLRRAQGDRKGESNDMGNLGLVYQSLGEYDKAMSFYQKALDIQRELGYREGEAYQLGGLADLYMLQGDYARAVQTYQEAFEIHRDIGHIRGQATWQEALGETYAAVGDFNRALDNFQSALNLHKSIGNRSGEAETLTKIGCAYLKTDKTQPARDYFEQALKIHAELGEKWGECVDLGNLAFVYSLEKDSKRALSTWEKAVRQAQELGARRLQAWLQLQLGDFYRQVGETDKAAKVYEQGLSVTESLFAPELRWQLYYGRGQLWESSGDDEQAYYSYHGALSVIEEIRGKAGVEEMKAGVMHDRFEVYQAMVLLLLRMGRIEEAPEYSERARSRTLLDVVGNAKIIDRDTASQELIDKERALRAKITKLTSQISTDPEAGQKVRGAADEVYHRSLQKAQRDYQHLLIDLRLRNPEYAALLDVSPLSSTQIQRLLDENSVLLEYLVTENNIIIFIVTDDNVHVVNIPEGEESVYGRIALFRGMAVRRMDKEKLDETFWIKPLQRLYQLLIAPVRDQGYLAGKRHLIIIPHGLLHYLPFQVLISHGDIEDKNGVERPRFLIEDYEISYAPSASVLRFCQQKNTERFDDLLLLAPQTSVLPLSKREVMEVADTFGKSASYYLDKKATETLVKNQSDRYDLLHFATTAHFNNANPLFSRLDLARSELDDGYLEVNEIFRLDMNANLVTLSACRTALGSGYTGKYPQGDDLVSLTRAFLYAGTPSVVASLWEVADASTAELMQAFYRYLNTMNKAQALAQAQRDMIADRISDNKKKGKLHYSHPYYWAPFVLVGDWK